MLFNFQGPSRLSSGDFLILPLSASFVKHFFEIFFRVFGNHFPDFKTRLTPDFADCEALFGEPLGPALKVLDYNITPYYFCQHFFPKFLIFS